MRYIFTLTLIFTLGFASTIDIHSFEADFQQKIVNDKGETLHYSGTVKALKPQYALWKYTKPVEKDIYINNNRVTIIEPDIEQVIIQNIYDNFDFFKLIKNAKKVSDDKYVANFEDVSYTITLKSAVLDSISYKDELDNSVLITFTHQAQNREINATIFSPAIPFGYDVIRD